MVECAAHAVFAAQVGPCRSTNRLARLEPGMLLMADRGITGFELWRAASGTGADLLWRVRKNIVLPLLPAMAGRFLVLLPGHPVRGGCRPTRFPPPAGQVSR